MKQLYTLLLILFSSLAINAQIIDIPDANFKNALVNTNCVDTNGDGWGNIDADADDDGEIDLSEAITITHLRVPSSSIDSLSGIENFTNLTTLNCASNEINNLSFAGLSNLTNLLCQNNNLTTLDVSGLTNLVKLKCYNNEITTLNFGLLTNLTSIECNENQLSVLDLSALPSLVSLNCDNNQLSVLDLSALPSLVSLNCNNNQISNLNISDLSNLVSLNCRENNLTELNLNGLPNIGEIFCGSNQINSISADIGSSIYFLSCGENLLTEISEESFSNLWYLACSNNDITEIDLNLLPNLTTLGCSSNQISELDLTNVSLNSLYCQNNLLTSLDVSNMTAQHLNCSNNQLVTLNIKNGYINSNGEILSPYDTRTLDFSNNPDLVNICADDEPIYAGNWPYYELNKVQYLIDQYGYTNCSVNGYCSFVPGGDYFSIEGITTIDIDDNGCDDDDSAFPSLKFEISNENDTGNLISDTSGSYSIPVSEGTHTITPVLENLNYYTINPENKTIDFPTDTSPFIQDFCITPNGTFNDLEITIIPVEAARPGFDTDYKVVYKNKGTTTLSGDINFGFQDDVMDFVSSTPANESGLTDLLSWSFTGLEPFESAEINLLMNLNAPTETPALNGDDILNFIASISASETDETPDDNTFELNQTVVNSYDPNDKTCLEGDFISPEMIGDYVHYMIRFENTGSASAVNVVVKDIIDTSKYDLATLVPLRASHDFVARIKNTTQDHYVEFIFENINLPFDDANNDGFIVFKIKTLDTLVLNDTIENSAEIYFDFNFPIITNTAQTTIATLNTDEFELANNTISLYPNPTTHILYLESNHAIKQIAIYDISGRRIKEIAVIGTKTEINISTESLASGSYFVKIKTAQGETVKKVIKD